MDDLESAWLQAPPTDESSRVLNVDRQVITPMPVQMEPFLLNQRDNSQTFIHELFEFSYQTSDIPIHDLKLLFSNCPDSDKNYLSFLNNIQSEIFDIYKVPMNSIHSAQSILFYDKTLQASDLVLNTLRFGYKPG